MSHWILIVQFSIEYVAVWDFVCSSKEGTFSRYLKKIRKT
uniref:Uncharacterized protein n=1 Tax=Arundo donax TaxID=35708 RepID=A0A0A9EKA5_ARUDO